MRYRHFLVCALLVASFGLGGCATSRSELRLGSPGTASQSALPDNAPVAVIRTVKDERIFEGAPTDPSIPSLGFEGAAQATTEVKLRAIGRKRNSYGMALGDVLLEQGQTVESVVRENVAASLREAGYKVLGEAPGVSPALTVDVQIRKFWSWIQPGFWAITVKSEVVTDISLPTRPGITTVNVSLDDPRAIVTETAWLEAMEKTLQAYRGDAGRKLSAAWAGGDTSNARSDGRAPAPSAVSGSSSLPARRPDGTPPPAARPSGAQSPVTLDDLSGLLGTQ
jgi:hypothetical protein